MKIKVSEIQEMKRLMSKLLKKTFTKEDKERLSVLSAGFLFISKAIDYTDGYSLEYSSTSLPPNESTPK